MELKNKPLIEAILEVRWALQGKEDGPQTDPHFKILLGRFYDRIIGDYPHEEQLPAASVPEEVLGRAVRHRFRAKVDGWPLVQIGPGMLSFNSTDDYSWDDYREKAIASVGRLFDAHPKVTELQITNLILRYIDAVEFDYNSDDAFKYVLENLKVRIELPANLFGKEIDSKPLAFDLHTSHKCSTPVGIVTTRFASGQKLGKPVILWETILESAGENLLTSPEEFPKWIDSAHEVTRDWFFKLIEGELLKRFKGD